MTPLSPLLAPFLCPDFFFVQIGANDGRKGDPLQELVRQHRWKGVLVEPLPDVFETLKVNYRDQPQLAFENAALFDADGKIDFYRHPRWSDCSGILPLTKIQKRAKLRKITVPSITWSTLIAKHKITRIDLLQVDVEGLDWEIISLLDRLIIPRVIHFEHKNLPKHTHREAIFTLIKWGYDLTQTDEKNTAAILRG